MVKDNKGQVLVETVFVILFVLGLFFSLVQLFLLSTTRIVVFDAAQAAARADIVNKNHRLAAMYVLSSQQLFKQLFPSRIKIEYPYGYNSKIITSEIKYLQKVVFPSFFTLFKLPLIPGVASCRMCKSPEPEFLNKSWPGAEND